MNTGRDKADEALVKWLTLHLAAMQLARYPIAEATALARDQARALADAAVDAAVAEVSAMLGDAA